ncbi:uncharacterized protein LOC144451073 [Glandiceps talaboti]
MDGTARIILCIVVCLTALSLEGVNGDYCYGYYDSYGNYVSGFTCSSWSDESYCCGSSYTYKYCCDYSTYWGYDDESWNDSDFDAGTGTGAGSIIAGGVFGTIGLIVLIVVSIVLCVCCCAKSSGGTRTTTTHVVRNPTNPTVIAYSSQNQQVQAGYNYPPPGYNTYPPYPPPSQYGQPAMDDPAYPPSHSSPPPYSSAVSSITPVA